MEPESPSPYPQVTANCPYPEPTPSSPHDPLLTSWRSILILSFHLRLGLPNGLFPSGFSTNTLCTPLSSPTRATCPAHPIRLNFTTRTILGKEYRSFSSSIHLFALTHSILKNFSTLERGLGDKVLMTKTAAIMFCVVYELYILPNCSPCWVKQLLFLRKVESFNTWQVYSLMMTIQITWIEHRRKLSPDVKNVLKKCKKQ
jgi:hypothetical protein